MTAKLDYTTQVETLDGRSTDLTEHQGKVLLIVNTASKCGLTPQYAGLQALYDELADQGFVILGFPCNQFAGQEPGDREEIASFCEINYGVSFPMYAKIDVNGPQTHPLFAQLKAAAPGLLGSQAIKWNFTKFLVDREGRIVRRFSPQTEPKDLAADVRALL